MAEARTVAGPPPLARVEAERRGFVARDPAAILILPPADEPGGDANEGRAQANGAPQPDRAGCRPRILLVEDDFLVGMEVESGLVEAGFDLVGIAVTAEEAEMLADRHRPALAIVDVRLAGERDGIDAALEMYRRHGIRSVFASAQGDRVTRARAASAGMAAWVDKPYRIPMLLVAIRGAFESMSGEPLLGRPQPFPAPGRA